MTLAEGFREALEVWSECSTDAPSLGSAEGSITYLIEAAGEQPAPSATLDELLGISSSAKPKVAFPTKPKLGPALDALAPVEAVHTQFDLDVPDNIDPYAVLSQFQD